MKGERNGGARAGRDRAHHRGPRRLDVGSSGGHSRALHVAQEAATEMNDRIAYGIVAAVLGSMIAYAALANGTAFAFLGECIRAAVQ